MMRVLIGGGSGFIGSALADHLRSRGDSVTIISRSPGANRITWTELQRGPLPPFDAVVNLAGQHILDPRRRWTEQYKEEVIRSRVDTTKALVDVLNRSRTPPSVFVSTAGKCFYGTSGAGPDPTYPELTEESEPMGIDFPAELVAQWEAAAEGVDSSRIRHVRVRIGVVLGAVERKSLIGKLWRVGRARGFLPIIRLPFCLGLGAKLGHGRQPFPWIHIKDMVGILVAVIDDTSASGRYNAVAPGIVNNAEFTEAFAKRLRRPVVWAVPAWLIKGLVGVERASILLEGQNVKPRRTLEQGYKFEYASIDAALDDLVQISF
ncbi:uncharacterized protein (TIGR01777 family) [Hydrogenophaga palleronii]|uniref:Uncharacterized protein (TIGR01777 family) n=1 Tax=Hydrogenophaga palleronii TaxID=65655 RepID=A0ABU1WJQ8_9BURK|nr:TIGR01777 family oxidoreductase [Hydrogenophaga palleronii]MDR7149520.1 uncharacterized protein (TIGR01777 family) [Hydrogenophaga palleronii]